jgi:hypothetical protein
MAAARIFTEVGIELYFLQPLLQLLLQEPYKNSLYYKDQLSLMTKMLVLDINY